MRLAVALALGLTFAGAARADDGPACAAFGAELDRGLALGPDAIQLNNYLFQAAAKGCVAATARLLQAGASRLARNRDGDAALAIAARAGRLPVATALLAGASAAERRQIDLGDARGATPLSLAIHFGHARLARALIAAGAAIDAADAMGETPLAEAAYAADEETALALLRKGAKPDTRDRSGKAPMTYAAARGAAGLVGALLDAGVDVNARYDNDLTALMWASGFSNSTPTAKATATLRLLIARGAKLDLVDDRGRSALMIAAALNHFEAVQALREAGADGALLDKSGKTAADLSPTPEMRAALTSASAGR